MTPNVANWLHYRRRCEWYKLPCTATHTATNIATVEAEFDVECGEMATLQEALRVVHTATHNATHTATRTATVETEFDGESGELAKL